MQNAEFVDLTQTTIFYIQDFQTKKSRLIQKSRQLSCKNHTYKPEITSGKKTRGTRTSKPDGSLQPIIHVFFKLLTSQNASKINHDLQSSRCNYVLQRERVFQRRMTRFRAQKLRNMALLLKTQHIQCGLSEIIRLNFLYSQLISFDLSEIIQLKNNSTN